MSVLKRCPRCQCRLPADSLYFSVDPRCRGGLSSWCKRCTNEENLARWHRQNPSAKRYNNTKYRRIEAAEAAAGESA